MKKSKISKDLIRRFIGNISEKGYIKKGDRILISCSGGVDSTVMLDLLYRIKDKFSLKLKIVHLNHSLRDRESDRDEEFVKRLAEEYELNIITESGKVKELLSLKKYSIEEKARFLRYDFFERKLKEEDFDKVATGHNANDQAETVIMNFIKGYSLESLKGIKEVRDNYIRPLIIFTRDEINNYAKSRHINYIVDSTNADLKYQRNKIRHKLLPLLKSNFNFNIIETLNHWGMLFNNTDDMIKNVGNAAFKEVFKNKCKNKFRLDINKFKDYFIIIRRHILVSAFKELKIFEKGTNKRIIDKIISLVKTGKVGKIYTLSKDYKVLIDRKELVIFKDSVIDFNFEISICEKHCFLEGRIKFESSIIDNKKGIFVRKDENWDELVDYNKIDKNSLILRSWRKGDRFIPLGMNQEKKLSDFFIDEKVSFHLKNNIPILVSGNEIIWICGFRINDKVKITKKTEKILRLKCSYI